MTRKKHTIYIATVGSSIEPIQRGILYAGPDIIYLLYSNSPKLKERNPKLVATRVKENARTFGIKHCHLNEIDPFSLESVMTQIIKIWQRHVDDKIIANMTGGTNIMASACLLAGFSISAKVIYVREILDDEELPLDDQVVVLPTPSIPFTGLSKEHREIIRLIYVDTKSGTTVLERANTVIADLMKITPQTVTHHLKRMETLGLIERHKEGRKINVQLTPSGLLFARMLE